MPTNPKNTGIWPGVRFFARVLTSILPFTGGQASAAGSESKLQLTGNPLLDSQSTLVEVPDLSQTKGLENLEQKSSKQVLKFNRKKSEHFLAEFEKDLVRGFDRKIKSFDMGSVDINFANPDGWTAAALSILYNNKEAFEDLVAHGANLNVKTADGHNLLMIAAEYNANIETLKFLKDKLPINEVDNNGWTAATQAVCDGDLATLQWLEDNGSQLDIKTSAGQNLLMIAAEFNADTTILKFLKDKLPINEVDNNGWSAAAHAARNGKLAILQWLEDNGSQLDIKTSAGQNLLMIAAEFNADTTILEFLKDKFPINEVDNNGWTAAAQAARHGYLATLHWLEDNGSQLDIKTSDGRNLFMIAAEYNANIEMLKFLKDKLPINEVDNNGWTSAAQAARHGNLATLQLLEDNGSKLDIKISDGRNLLMIAAEFNADTTILEFLKDKFPINEVDNKGWTAAAQAARHGYLATLHWLEANGSQLDIKTSAGQSLLMIAAEFNANIETLKFLTDKLSINDTDNNGWTAATHAAQKSNFGVLEFLIQNNADITIKTSGGKTVLDFAKSNGSFSQEMIESITQVFERQQEESKGRESLDYKPLAQATTPSILDNPNYYTSLTPTATTTELKIQEPEQQRATPPSPQQNLRGAKAEEPKHNETNSDEEKNLKPLAFLAAAGAATLAAGLSNQNKGSKPSKVHTI